MSNSKGYRVAILGASGYGGIQLVRILNTHPSFKITFLGGDRTAGNRWNEICPFLPLNEDLLIENVDINKISDVADFVLLSLPNGCASQLVPQLLQKELRVIDLSADYRYRSLDLWKRIYTQEASNYKRNDYDLCKEASYGLSEYKPKNIANSRICASPGCFPTASLLPLIPFLNQGLIDLEGIVIDAKSGTSGGGRLPKQNLLLAECSESIIPYGVIGHRHTSEIEQEASEISSHEIEIQFTPHLLPMVRGLLATIYGRLRDPGLTAEDCTTVLQTYYQNQPFIEVVDVGLYPATKWVRHTNKAILSVQVDKRNGRIILISVIDNLIKGQAGQAIQNLNIMAGLDQTSGLPLLGYYP